MAYENLGQGALEYYPCRYGNSKLLFRGPKRSLDGSFVAVLGGTETYGKFIADPYPALLERTLGTKVVNFGCVNAGADVFINDQTILKACSDAAVTVIQITGAQNLSNRFYAVHPRRNDRFLRASNLLKTIYREVDFTEFNFTRHLLKTLKEVSADRFAMVEQELKAAWVGRMRSMISKIEGKVVLLWMSDHSPGQIEIAGIDGTDPLFVGQDMIDEIRPFVAGIVEAEVSQDEIHAGMDDMVFTEMEMPVASGMLGALAHNKAAEALQAALRPYL